MKTTILTLALAAASFAAVAQSKPGSATPAAASAAPTDTYSAMMAATIGDIMKTGDPTELKALAAKMERAATVAPADWLPRYYQAYSLLISVFNSKEDGDAKDKTLDQVDTALGQVRKLHCDESELLTLQAYAYQARLGISPMARSMKYSPMVNETVAQAKGLNPANPRAYLVGANNVYFTPKMFGGGAEAAKPMFDEAKAKFAAFKPANGLAPSWGERQLQGRLKQYEASTAQAGK